ncbi:endothelin-converting enzyme 1-like [Belonocnema kinseyi]|uniref:endothelin-converting enzyme 1-like n=1 Tax=Belonocnema kinseyi TaxID=2817044 RepID=UPI00143D64D1|nr:endothelin-converting enzyme 1-like [Belonocnema kinseyi]
MDEDKIEQKGLEPLVDIIGKIGGWPLAMGSNVSKNHEIPWQNVAQYYAKLTGGFSLFNVFLHFDVPNNSSVQTLVIDRPKNALIYKWALINKYKLLNNKATSHAYNDDELHKIISLLYDDDDEEDSTDDNHSDNHDNEIADYMKKIVFEYAEVTGEKPNNVSSNILQLLKFEESLKEIKNLRSVAAYLELQNIRTISEFQEYYNLENLENTTSRINWLEMIQVLFDDTGIEIHGSQNITVRKRSYFHKLARLLNRTPNRIIVDHIHWSFVHDVLKYLDKKTRQWITDKDNAAYGIKKELARWEHCIKKMPIVEGISYEFVKVHFTDTKKENIVGIVEEIRNEIDFEISSASWMDEKSKSYARNKLKALKIKIGYPEWYKQEEMFSNYYYGLKVGPDYFTNFMNYLKFIKWKTLKEFREPLNKEKWPDSPITINAMYVFPGNVMFYLAGISLSPLYNPSAPLALRYGFSGFIIGHEISHAFAYKNFFYNEHGYLQTPLPFEVFRKIRKKNQCFINQYQNYKVNGILTAGENMADGGGLIAAFKVYRKKISDEKIKDTRLPGLEDVNGNELFFISFAAAFCQSATPEFLEKNKEDTHSTSQVRINGAVSNSVEFSETFNCPKTSPLNRDPKCVFWSEN